MHFLRKPKTRRVVVANTLEGGLRCHVPALTLKKDDSLASAAADSDRHYETFSELVFGRSL